MVIIRKSYLTLFEVLIVITLIMMILGVVGFNYRAALERGRAATTKLGMQKLENILLDHLALSPGDWDHIDRDWREWVKGHPLAQNPESVIRDGWGEEYRVAVEDNSSGEKTIRIESRAYSVYKAKNPGQGL